METAIALVGAALTLLGVLMAIAVTWGRIRQSLEGVLEAVDELNKRVMLGDSRTTALETTSEDHSERLDRLELPMFTKRR